MAEEKYIVLTYTKREKDSIPRVIKVSPIPTPSTDYKDGVHSISKSTIITNGVGSLQQTGQRLDDWTEILPGYSLLDEKQGVILYQNGSTFLQSIDLSAGASLKFLYGNSNLEGDNPDFEHQKIDKIWSDFQEKEETEFSIVNGQFFETNWFVWPFGDSKTKLSYPTKVDSKIISLGDNKVNDKKLKIFEVNGSTVSIREFDRSQFSTLTAPNIIAGFNYENFLPDEDTGAKTFIGIKDSDFSNGAETILIFSSKKGAISGIEAKRVLEKFGANNLLAIDSGSSPFLRTNKESFTSSRDYSPQAIGILYGV
jgi:hypothetical protein